MAELVGERYELHEEIGRGGTATVFRAYDVVLERFVALKLLAGPVAGSPEFLARLEREARLAARLEHPNVVTIFDYGHLGDGRAFIAMRMLEGRGLDDILETEAPLPAPQVASLVSQLASALDYTHAGGTIHRDVKPSNVIVTASGHATLTDFGIARAFDSTRLTMTGLTVGTPRYMAPEQIRGDESTSVTDVYALGVLAFEMLAGRPPFEGEGTGLMYRIVHEDPPAITDVNPQWGRPLAEVLRHALQRDPAKRWPSAGEFARALDEALRSEDPATPRPHDGEPRVASAPRTAAGRSTASSAGRSPSGRRNVYLAVGAVAALAIAAALFFMFVGDADARPREVDPPAAATAVESSTPADATDISPGNITPTGSAVDVPVPSPDYPNMADMGDCEPLL